MKQSRREFLVRTTCAAHVRGRGAGEPAEARPHEPVRQALGADRLPRHRLHLPGRRQRLEQHGRARPTASTRTSTRWRGRRTRASRSPAWACRQASCPSARRRASAAAPSASTRACAELAGLYSQNKLAVVSNVGPLVEPVTQANIDAQAHAVLALLALRPDRLLADGARRPAHRDRLGRPRGRRHHQLQRRLGLPDRDDDLGRLDASASAPASAPLAIDTGALDQVLVLNGFYGSPQDVARKNSMDYARTIDRTASLIAAASDTTQQAVDISAALSVDPTLTTVFPRPYLGDQLLQVAKVMKLNLTSPRALAQPPDLLRRDGRLRHAPGPGARTRRPSSPTSRRR